MPDFVRQIESNKPPLIIYLKINQAITDIGIGANSHLPQQDFDFIVNIDHNESP